MTNILYKYAFDENKNLICINDLTKDIVSNHTYTCPNCGAIMSTKIGNGGKSPHFAHKITQECNSETYLHKLAKIVLKKRWYDKTKDFKIKYKQIAACIKKDFCPIFEKEYCSKDDILSFNLKNEYNECFEEKKIDGFVADLLITSNKYPEKPIMVEFWVSHESSEKKKISNHKIIEIKIETLDDVLNLEKGDIVESDKVSFIGTFIKDSKHREQLIREGITHFKLFRSGKVFMPTCSCDKIPHKSGNTLFECLISSYAHDMGIPVNIKKIGLLKAKECNAIGRLCSNCALYKYNERYNRNICILYKKYNLPMEPNPISAVDCLYYRKDTSNSSWGVTNDEKNMREAKIMIISS